MPSCKECHKYDPVNRSCSVADGSPIRKCVIALLEKELTSLAPGLTVLEIGCGSWDLAKKYVESNGCQWFGIDPVELNEHGTKTIATYKGSVDKIPFEDDYFDYVLGNQTIEHWHEWNVTFNVGLHEIYRVLKADGVLSMNFPIHLHGHSIFVKGDILKIINLFHQDYWEIVHKEEWRKDYEPLEPFYGYLSNGYKAEDLISDQKTPSSWIMNIIVKKKAIFQTNYVYNDRETKQRFVYEKYRSILKSKVLDVGADKCYLKNNLSSDVEYVGIGYGSSSELIKVDLEKEKIPFSDKSFNCVLCLDVLEHLENIHEMFDELCRVSKKWVIISLPNPYADLMQYFSQGRYKGGPKNTKFYGLPLEREPDRHKWFFSSIEVREFVKYRAEKNNMSVFDLYIEGKGSNGLFKAKGWREKIKLSKLIDARKLFFREDFEFSEIYEGTMWWVLKKN